MNFAFARARHDRAGNLRADRERWDTPALKVMVLGGEHVATVDGPHIAWFSRDDVPEGQWMYLGELNDQHYAAVIVPRVEQDLAPASIRVLAAQLEPDELSLAIHAVAMGRWLDGHSFCSRCGEELVVREAGHQLHCERCAINHFPRTDPAVIMLVVDDQDRALLARNTAWHEGRFSTLAGFVEPGESLEDTVRREVAEEVGVQIGEVTYLGSQPWPFPSSLMLGFQAKAVDPTVKVDHDEIAEARWFTRDELREATHSGEVLLPPSGVSISSWLIEEWLGEELTGGWF